MTSIHLRLDTPDRDRCWPLLTPVDSCRRARSGHSRNNGMRSVQVRRMILGHG
jgi:hypothetical protein